MSKKQDTERGDVNGAGVTRVPQDYLNVARVLRLSEWKVFSKILFPAVSASVSGCGTSGTI